MTRPDAKRALFVIYPRFEETEYGIPLTLAKAGVVKGKRVTAAMQWNVLEKAGATVVTNASVVRDGLLITANGPGRARQFGEAIAAALGE